MKGKLLKKVTVAALSLLIVSGGIPFQPVSDLLGSTVIKAEARTYDSYSHVNCTDCSVGDIFEAGAELFNNTDNTIYLSFPDNPSLYEQLDSREGTIIGVKYKIVSKSGSTWTLTTDLLNNTSITRQPDVNGVILYDGTAKKIIESGAAVSGNQTVYYGISDYYYSEPSSWYTDINSSGLKVTDKGEYFLWIKTNGNSSYKPLSPRVQATITVTDQAYMLESYYWGGSNQDGTQSHPFLISDTKGWNFLCDALQHNDIFNRFEGKYFRLNNNITVTRMAGGSQHDFKGTFDGNQKTLTFNYTATGDNAAPFSHTDTGCTIKNLHIAGTINTSYKYAAGLIAQVYGTLNIENCRSSVTINSSTDGDGTHGGFVGASNSSSALTIKGCVFDGKFIGSKTHSWGGFVGWRQSTANIYNSVFAPSEIDIKQSKEKCATFARNKIDTYNCYFTETLNDGTNYLPYVDDDTVTPRKCNNGLKAYTISATDDITFSLSGTATTYNVSGITAYANNCGLKYGNTVYAGNGDRVALTLPTTEQNKNYEVNAGTISGSTLTMPAENVTISKFTGGTTGDCTWRLDDNGVLTISGNGAMGNYSASSSSSTAPWGNNIKSVIIENGVTSIGNYAFRNCYALTNISIPNSVTNIGYFAFSSCGSLTNITIPDSVTSIGSSVFSVCGNLKSVSFGNGLTSINDFMFSGCGNLTTVTMKNNVTSIGKYAFNNCEKLNSINISSAVTTIGESAFYNCKGLTSVTIPASVTSIGENAFYGCNTLTSVTLSEGLKTISSKAFYNCNALKSVFIPESVTSIGNNAFGCYDNNNSVYIMMDFTVYGYKGSKAENYAKNSGLKFTAIPKIVSSGTTGDCTWTLDENGLLTISGSGAMGKHAYTSKPWGTNIKCVVIENGVTDIGVFAFADCRNLTSVTIPNSVTTIGECAFTDCTGLTSVTIPNSVKTIGNYAFDNCKSLTSITIPNSVTTIGYCAFTDCTGLTSVTIPNSVTAIDEKAFGYYYDNDNSDYVKTDGFTIYCNNTSGAAYNYAVNNGFRFVVSGTTGDCTWTLDENGLLTISGNGAMGNNFANSTLRTNIKSVIIENGVTTIGKYAFYYCTGLTSVTIPNSVTSIGNYAFEYSTGLTSMTIPNSVTSIGNNAFYDCTSLTSVTIPNSVTTIGVGAFQNCTSLTSVIIPDSVTTIENYAFYNCEALTSVTIPESIITIREKTFCGCTSLTSVTIPNSVTTIGNYAFYSCTSLTSVTVPNSVTSIGNYAFGYYLDIHDDIVYSHITINGFTIYCNNTSGAAYNYAVNNGFCFVVSGTTGDCTWTLDENGLLTISGSGAMENYTYSPSAPWGTNIKSVVIENGVTAIGKSAFYHCTGLTSVTIPDSVTTIGHSAFEHCTGLTSVTIPNSVTTIDHFAFYDCTGLTSVTIPNSVTTIGNSAFCGCYNLKSVTIPNSVTSIGEKAFGYYYSDDNHAYVKTDGFTIYCDKDSAAYNYAVNNGFRFVVSGTTGDCTWTLDTDGLLTISGSGAMGNYSASSYVPWGTNIKSVIIENGVTAIGSYAFWGCRKLTSITIPDSVTTIGDGTFGNCTVLKSVTIPNSVTTIGDYAFFNCTSLTSVTIGNSVTSIGVCAFAECTVLTSVTIGNSVTTIGDYAFNNCRGLTSVTIPNSVTTIGYNAFYDCRGLTSVTIGNSVTTINEMAFFNCTGLTSVTIGNSVTTINEMAFFNCTGLTSVTIPDSVTAIGNKAFGYYEDDDYNFVKTDGFTIYGYKNSVAENYATENGFAFVPTVESVDLNKHTLVLGVGQAYTLKPIVTPEGAETTFKWKSSKKDIATVTSLGKVTGRAVGKATVTVTTANGKTYSCTVVVKQAPDNITLNKSEMTLGVGQMYTLQSTLTPSDSATYQQWTSSDKTIAVVNDKGRVTGKKVGTATITVKTTNGHTATCIVTVKKAPTSVALDKTAVTLAVGMKETLTATLTPTNSATYCAWSSSDETVATVTSGGVITAKKAGTATITVKTTNDKTATCTVTVKKAPTALELDKTELSLKVGETHTLKKTLTPSNAYTTYTYTSSKTAVATITSSGKVVAKKAGTAVITITTHNGKTATCTVTVK